ncbi:FIST signal transduction protein [Echinimonas agarilytica]|uniref:FIST C-terminal domain-containing protein n=1 Tax=Echinimonas agarilytica TaxID=1215918 RepID=A0AA41W9U8_9GAMM|nr:FIST N-terminal domain-containing protein [Echinimonas agarilytica]MCM2681271.1 FIST C-terminal domain-containing protein [Echinimonas agarilytica]
MHILTAQSDLDQPQLAVKALLSRLGDMSPCFMVVAGSPAHHFSDAFLELKKLYPDTHMIGCSSYSGLFSEQGYCSSGLGRSLGIWALSDTGGSYGAAMRPYGNNPQLAAKEALEEAFLNSERVAEMPALIWMHASPGHEERVLEAIRDYVGPSVPVIGGAAAPSPEFEQQAVACNGAVEDDGVTIAVMFPSGRVGYSFHSGCSMAEPLGRVTKVMGRTLVEIDHQPAIDVYEQAVGVPIVNAIETQNWTILPVGRVIGEHLNMPVFTLSIPIEVNDQGVNFLTELKVGEQLYLMSGNESSLRGRGARVAEGAMKMLPEGRLGLKPIGALMVYCACCMQVVSNDLQQVVDSTTHVLGTETPVLTMFTYGEQGPLLDSQNVHGNLMIASAVFYGEACSE